MDLKRFFSKESETDEYYWSVVIESSWVHSGIWKVVDDRVEVVSFGLTISWHESKGLVDALDSSLSAAIQNLHGGLIEPQKTVLGLAPIWLEGETIKLQYQEEIKRVCESLSLKPVGFVSLTEAISHYFKSQEGDFLSGIIIYFDQDRLGISLVIRGETRGETEVFRSVSLVDDLVEGLTRFSLEEPLPPRVILYDGRESEIEDARQALVNVNWEEYQNISFLHPPKIELIKPDEKVLAVSLAGGIEMKGVKEVKATQFLAEAEEEVESGKSDEGSDFDIDSLNLVVKETMADLQEDEKLDDKDSRAETTIQPNYQKQSKISLTSWINPLLISLRNFLNKLFTSGFPLASKKKSLAYGFLVVLIVLVSGFLAWWFIPSAVVKIYVSPQKIEESLELGLDKSAASADLSSKIIPAREVEREATGEKTIPVTGKKLVGDKAKGKVQIYRTGDEINLAKNTKLQSSSGLVFTLDDDVIVASGSASTPSKTDANVTAFDIGAEYNLAAGETFSVGNYTISTVEAKNEEPFSGGSSREISTVSAKDYDALLSSLEEELTNRILSGFEEALGDNEMLVKESIRKEVKDKVYDRKVGDESNNLKLNLTLSSFFLVVNKSDFYDLAKEVLREKIPSGYTLRQDQLKVSFSYGEEKDGKAVFKTNFIANLLPKVEQEEIARSIAGRSPESAKDFLVGVKGYNKAEIRIKPDFGVQRLLVLPHLYRKISIEVEAYP